MLHFQIYNLHIMFVLFFAVNIRLMSTPFGFFISHLDF